MAAPPPTPAHTEFAWAWQ